MTTPTAPLPPPRGKQSRRKIRVILYNGWLRTYKYPRLWMAPLAEHLRSHQYQEQDQEGGGEENNDVEIEVIGNTMPVQTSDAEKYIKHLAALVGADGPDEDTFFIGQSIGCQVILRYLARLPPDTKVGGCLLAGCWLKLDKETRRRRSSAIDELIRDEWDTFEKGWMNYETIDFRNVQQVCREGGKLMCLMADNDPYRGLDDDGLSNKKDFEEIVGAQVIFRHGRGHYNMSRLDEDDTLFIEEGFLGVCRKQKPTAAEEEQEMRQQERRAREHHVQVAKEKRRAKL